MGGTLVFSSSTDQAPRTRILVRVSADEKSRIELRAKATGVTVSTYLKSAATGQPLRSVEHHERVQAALSVRGDVGRYGGLLKYWLSLEPKTDGFDRVQIRAVLGQTEEALEELKRLVKRALRPPQHANFKDEVSEGDPSVKRSRSVQVYLTVDERDLVRTSAARLEVTVSCYIRRRAVSLEPYEGLSQSMVSALAAERQALRPLGDLLKFFLTDAPDLSSYPPAQVHAALRGSLHRAGQFLTHIKQLANRPHERSSVPDHVRS